MILVSESNWLPRYNFDEKVTSFVLFFQFLSLQTVAQAFSFLKVKLALSMLHLVLDETVLFLFVF